MISPLVGVDRALTCTFFSDAHRAVARQLRDWFAAAGLASEIDPIGNVVGRMPGARPGRER